MKLPTPIFFIALIPVALILLTTSSPSTYAPINKISATTQNTLEKGTTKQVKTNVLVAVYKGIADKSWAKDSEQNIYFAACDAEISTCKYIIASKSVAPTKLLIDTTYTISYEDADILDVTASAGTQYITVSKLVSLNN